MKKKQTPGRGIDAAPPGFRWVYCRYFRHYITKKLVYPKKSEFFRFLVRA